MNEGEIIEAQVDEVFATTGAEIRVVTADAVYAYAKVYGGLERRGIDPLIPAKAEPFKSCVPSSPIPLRGRARYLEVSEGRDNRLFVEAVLFRFRAGLPWRDLPERFGDWKIVYQRFNRWPRATFSSGFSGSSPATTTTST